MSNTGPGPQALGGSIRITLELVVSITPDRTTVEGVSVTGIETTPPTTAPGRGPAAHQQHPQQQQQQQQPARRSRAQLVRDNLHRQPVHVLLHLCGVKGPDELLMSFTDARIREVCIAALTRRARIRNRGGWVRSALNNGWSVTTPEPEEAPEIDNMPGALLADQTKLETPAKPAGVQDDRPRP